MSKRTSDGKTVRGGSVVARGVPDVKTESARALISTTKEWKALEEHVEDIEATHLR